MYHDNKNSYALGIKKTFTMPTFVKIYVTEI